MEPVETKGAGEMICKVCGERARCVRVVPVEGGIMVRRERVCDGCGAEVVTQERVLTIRRVRVVGMRSASAPAELEGGNNAAAR